MINLRNSPFLWLAIMLLVSYRIGAMLPETSFGWSNILICTVCFICGSAALLKYAPKLQFISSILIGVFIFSAGIIRFHQFNGDQFPGQPLPSPLWMEGAVKINQVLKNKTTSVSLNCDVIFLNAKDTLASEVVDKNILVIIQNPSTHELFPGDILMLRGKASAIQPPMNPFSFDPVLYYRTIGIRTQLSCKGTEIIKSEEHQNSLSRITARWQNALSSLVSHNISAQVAQLTNALVWGDRSDMDNDVRDAFADSGAMHVLSVSGMHVAIIYGMLMFFLGPPGSGVFMKRILRFTIYALAILLYVALTGSCPAVIRAGLMIILYLFGKAMGWNAQVWNLMGFAAFLMMWINPYLWENIGFQLSFLAMAGILLFSKPVIRSINFKSVILHWIWEVTALSIVAQIFILPILLGQFHQFPLTFILSSLVAIPAGYFIVFGAMLNVVLSFMGLHFAWPLLDWGGKAFINSMKWMAGLNPEMHFSLPAMAGICMMGMAIFFTISLAFKWKPGKPIGYAMCVASLTLIGCHRVTEWTNNQLIIYHSFKGLLVDLMIDGRCISIHDAALAKESIEFAANGFRCHKDIIDVTDFFKEQEFKKDGLCYTSYLIAGHDSYLQIWNGQIDSLICTSKPVLVLVDECPSIFDLMDYLKDRPDALIILPAYLNKKLKKKLQQDLENNHFRIHDMEMKGYYISSL